MTESFEHLKIGTETPDRTTIWIDVANRSMNVLFEDVFDELVQAIRSIETANESKPVLLRSGKKKGFVVGADLKRIHEIESDEQIQSFLKHGLEALQVIAESPLMTIAIIDGPCLGGGLELALTCKSRWVVNRESTQLGMPESKLGLIPGWGGTQRLPMLIGIESALRMLLSGESVSASRAIDLGLADVMLSESEVEDSIAFELAKLAHSSDPSFPARVTKGLQVPDDREWNSLIASKMGSNSMTESQVCIAHAVRIGLSSTDDAGYRAERTQFFGLLSQPAVQETLKRFNAPK